MASKVHSAERRSFGVSYPSIVSYPVSFPSRELDFSVKSLQIGPGGGPAITTSN